jgi:hypothetical protein
MLNNSLERTQPQRGFMYDEDMLRRSARSRYTAEAMNLCGMLPSIIAGCEPLKL